MRRLFSLCFALFLGLTAGAVDRVSWEITPRVTAPGQPFRLQIADRLAQRALNVARLLDQQADVAIDGGKAIAAVTVFRGAGSDKLPIRRTYPSACSSWVSEVFNQTAPSTVPVRV